MIKIKLCIHRHVLQLNAHATKVLAGNIQTLTLYDLTSECIFLYIGELLSNQEFL